MAIDHTGIHIPASQRAAVVAWYEAALEPVGYKKTRTYNEEIIGFSDPDPVPPENGYTKCDWWINGNLNGETHYKSHYAFLAKDHATVDAFYKAAIAAGGKDNGAPGLRPYQPNYYAAFVFDPVGNNIKVVCQLSGEGN
ncbi:hypothetical protein V5O48_015207 [Marasmius crinis-equi]|uniref:Glyoxalase/fosfomycin resistance/dioxygenase domain-containing protein n=1 Tax=Marasmius crinis-equi TaxID=585013 RepID=A0ABR3EV62_9AGAR